MMIAFYRPANLTAPRALLCACLVASFLFGFAGPVHAVDYFWNVAGPADWNNPANWNAGIVPVGGDNGRVENGGTANIGAAIANPEWITIAGAAGGNSTVTHNFAGNTTINQELLIGAWNTPNQGVFTQNAGTVNVTTNTAQTHIGGRDGGNGGNAGPGNGVYNLNGGTLNTGFLAVGSGANWNGGNGVKSTGEFNQTGAGSIVNANVRIGDWGNGTYNLSDGTINQNAGNFHIGTQGDSLGTLNQSGGTINNLINSDMYLGWDQNSRGIVNQSGGISQGHNNLVLGGTGNSSGEYHLNGGTLQINGNIIQTNGTVGVFYINGGTLTTNVNAQIAPDQLRIGSDGFTGSYTLANNRTINVGGQSGEFLVGFNGGNGTFIDNSTNANSVTTSSWISVGRDGAAVGNYTKTSAGNTTVGGALVVGINGGNGTMNINAGTVNVNGNGDNGSIRSSTIGQSGGTGIVTVAPGATLNVNGDQGLGVGWSGTGTLNNNGTTFVNNGVWIGHDTGTGTINNTGNFSTNNIIDIGRGNANGNGFFTNSGTVTTGGEMWVGSEGAHGTYTQTAGLTNLGGALTVGRAGGSVGTLAISGGTINAPNGDFRVGSGGGTGTVNQTGGTINSNSGSGWAFVGVDGGSTGTYNLSGPGTFNAQGTLLSVGWATNGAFNQTGVGSNVNANELWIGNQGGGNGSYTITNGNLNTNIIGLGRDGGTGVLHIEGGTVTNTGNINDGTGTGTLNINGGVLNMTNPNSNITVDFLNIGRGNLGAPHNGPFTGSYTNADNRTINVNGTTQIGTDGSTGTLNITGGSVTAGGNGNNADLRSMNIGRAGGTGTVTVSPGATLNVNGDQGLSVGWDATGTLNNNGTTTVNNGIWVGHGTGTGTINNTGSLSSTNIIQIGRGGANGQGFLTNSGTVTAPLLYIGDEGAHGTYTQNGAGSVTTVGSRLKIGTDSAGSNGLFTLNAGAVNVNGGGGDGGDGKGILAIGLNNSTGVLTNNGGNLTSQGRTVVGWESGNGTINQNAGNLTLNTAGDRTWVGMWSGTGTINQTGGTLTHNGGLNMADWTATATVNQTGGISNVNGSINFGENGGGGNGTIHLEGGTMNVTGNITRINSSATLNINGGVLNMTNGGSNITVDTLNIGRGNLGAPHNGPFNGNYTNDLNKSIQVNGDLSVGRDNSTGTFTQSSTNSVNVNGNVYVGSGAGGNGTVTMTNGNFNALGGGAGVLNVGHDGGNGTFNLNDTRPYSTPAGNDVFQVNELRVGTGTAGSVGNVNIRGANLWVRGTPIVGDTGQGNLTLNDSFGPALLETGNTLYVGNANGSVGTVTHSATADAQMWVGQVVLGNQAGSQGTYNMSGNAVLQGQGGPGTNIPNGITVGNGGTGTFNMSGGTIYTAGGPSVNIAAGGAGSVGTFNQSGGTINAQNWFQMGEAAGSVGTYNLSGTGVLNTTDITIGRSGTGVMNQSGGTVNSSAYMWLGSNAGGNGNYRITGGTLNTLAVNANGAPVNAGYAEFTVDGGNVNISTGNVNVTRFFVGLQTGFTGVYNMSQGTLNATDWITIGDTGTGTFNLTGGTVNSPEVNVGNWNGGNGTLNVSGASQLNTTDMRVGRGGNTGASIGLVSQSGGTVNVANQLVLGGNNGVTGSVGTYNLSSGALNVTNGIVAGDGNGATGTVNQSGGTATSGGPVIIGNQAGSLGAYNISAGVLNVNGGNNVIVGASGGTAGNRATLFVSGTGVVNGSGGNLIVGQNAGSFGLLRTGPGVPPQINSFFDVFVGLNGNGSVNLQGGVMTAGHDIQFGVNAGSTGGGAISGGTFTATNNLLVGVASANNNSVSQSGGTVSALNNMQIGVNAGSRGTYSISGGALNVTNKLSVGLNGGTLLNPATLNVSGTGVVTTKDLTVGQNAGSFGRLVQTGGTINVTNPMTYIVGDAGTATVTHSAGTTNDTGNLILGNQVTGNGTYDLSGTGALNIGVDSQIGNAGTGQFNQSGGTHTVTGNLAVAVLGGSNGSYNQSGGTLSVGGNENIGQAGTGVFLQTGGLNQLTGPTSNMNVGPNGPYTLGGGTLDFRDYVGTTPALAGTPWAPNNPSSLNLTVPGQFVFNGGTLLDVSTVNPNGTFLQSGGTFVIGRDESPNLNPLTPTSAAALTTINGGFNMNGGTILFDIFAEDTTPDNAYDPAQADFLDVKGNVTLNGTINVSFLLANTNYPLFRQEWNLIAADTPGGTITKGPNFGVAGAFYRIITDNAGHQVLQVYVPEPGTIALWSLVGLVAGGYALRRIRRTKRA